MKRISRRSHLNLNLGYASVAGGFHRNRGAEMPEGHRGLGPTRTETGHDRWALRFGRFRLYPAPDGPLQRPVAAVTALLATP